MSPPSALTTDPAHLRPDEVLEIIGFMADCDPIIVGGQSVNIWADFYSSRDDRLATLGALTSKDVDFFKNRAAAERLAARLEDGTVLLPGPDDVGTPNAAVVLGMLHGRKLTVDFMNIVLGVDDESISENFAAIEGTISGKKLSLLLMNPLDCLRSRLANINTLKRNDQQSVTQALASILVLENYIDDLIESENFKLPQKILKDLQFVIRDNHLGKESHLKFGDKLNLLQIMGRYINEARLDDRWRSRILEPAMDRLGKKAARLKPETSTGTEFDDETGLELAHSPTVRPF